MIEVLSNGALNSVQDLGRPSHLAMGVSRGGGMDSEALSIANWLAGNEADAAGIEVSIFPFKVRFHANTYFACTGAQTRMELEGRRLPSWWATQARAGDVLTLALPVQGCRSYLAFAGGIDVPAVLASRSTDLKSGFGGHEGRGLRKGDMLRLGPDALPGVESSRKSLGVAPPERLAFAEELANGVVNVRLVAGAEYQRFSARARDALVTSPFTLTPDCNRQGYRLEGAELTTDRPIELLSHGIVPGTVQAPPGGQPIIQLAEANTCGGYPKIGTVVAADLWRLGQLRPGQRLRFELVTRDEALLAARKSKSEQARILRSLAMHIGRQQTNRH